MHASLFVSAFLAMVAAQSSDNSPLTTITLAANAILGPATSSPPTITNSNAPITTITLSSGAILPTASIPVTTVSKSLVSPASSEPTVYTTSVITSTVCGSCSVTPVGSVTVAPVFATLRPSSSVVTFTRNSSVTPAPNVLPIYTGNTLSNGTVINGANDLMSAGTLAISAGVLAASYFAFAL